MSLKIEIEGFGEWMLTEGVELGECLGFLLKRTANMPVGSTCFYIMPIGKTDTYLSQFGGAKKAGIFHHCGTLSECINNAIEYIKANEEPERERTKNHPE